MPVEPHRFGRIFTAGVGVAGEPVRDDWRAEDQDHLWFSARNTQVSKGDHIFALGAGRGSIVITADIPLASRCVKAGADVIGPTGRAFTEASIGMALATRNLMEDLRAGGEITGGPPPFSPRDRSTFLSALDLAIVRLKRAGFGGA